MDSLFLPAEIMVGFLGHILPADADLVPIAGTNEEWEKHEPPQMEEWKKKLLVVGMIYFCMAVNLMATEALKHNCRHMVNVTI